MCVYIYIYIYMRDRGGLGPAQRRAPGLLLRAGLLARLAGGMPGRCSETAVYQQTYISKLAANLCSV